TVKPVGITSLGPVRSLSTHGLCAAEIPEPLHRNLPGGRPSRERYGTDQLRRKPMRQLEVGASAYVAIPDRIVLRQRGRGLGAHVGEQPPAARVETGGVVDAHPRTHELLAHGVDVRDERRT